MEKTLQRSKEDTLNAFYKKKTVVNFYLSALVMLTHIHSFDSYEYTPPGGTCLQFLGVLLTSGMTGCAVRLFFIISGVLFYRNYTYGHTLEKYKSRAKSLLLPYLFWCCFYTILMLGLGLTPFRRMLALDMRINLKNILMGVFLNQYYKSFWFIFDLIIFTLICPVIYTLLRNKLVGAGVLAVSVVLYGMGIRIPETVQIAGQEYILFWRADSIIFYMLGAYIGLHFFNWFTSKKTPLVAVIGLIGYIGCSVYRAIGGHYNEMDAGIGYLVFMTIFCFSLWFLFDLFHYGKRLPELVSYSFMMFAMNFYLGVYISKILYLILPKSQIWCLANLALTVGMELAVILSTSHILSHKCNRFYRVIVGGR